MDDASTYRPLFACIWRIALTLTLMAVLADQTHAADPSPESSDEARQKYLELLRDTKKRRQGASQVAPARPTNSINSGPRTPTVPPEGSGAGNAAGGTRGAANIERGPSGGSAVPSGPAASEVTDCQAFLQEMSTFNAGNPGILDLPADAGPRMVTFKDGDTREMTAEERAWAKGRISTCEATIAAAR